MQHFGMSMLWFWICYLVVTAVGILHTIFNIYVLKMTPMDENGMGEGYEKTKPWHPLYNIVLFSLFGWLYMKGLDSPTISEALITGAIWAGICIVFDVIGWVLVKTDGEVRFVAQFENMLIFEADRDAEINTLIDSINKRFNSEGR